MTNDGKGKFSIFNFQMTKNMNSFDLLSDGSEIKVKARGSTRAGLITAALKGMFALAEPKNVGDADGHEVQFHVTAEDGSELLADVLNEALSSSENNQEIYDEVRFDLITDKEAKGAFIGKPVSGFGKRIKAAKHHGLKVEKNAEGMWEATVTFQPEST
jgi:SHS2 domain-containing protein